jgi:hypothetical protein
MNHPSRFTINNLTGPDGPNAITILFQDNTSESHSKAETMARLLNINNIQKISYNQGTPEHKILTVKLGINVMDFFRYDWNFQIDPNEYYLEEQGLNDYNQRRYTNIFKAPVPVVPDEEIFDAPPAGGEDEEIFDAPPAGGEDEEIFDAPPAGGEDEEIFDPPGGLGPMPALPAPGGVVRATEPIPDGEAGEPTIPFVQRLRCVICMTNAVNTRLNPCGHLLCSQCFELLPHPKSCPLCRTVPVNSQPIFYGGGYYKKYQKYTNKIKLLN